MANAVAVMAVFVAAVGLTWLAIVVARRTNVVATPDHRSSHSLPTPTMGGVAIVVPSIVWVAINHDVLPVANAVLCGGLLIAIVGMIDDIRDLPARIRFPIHILGASIAVWMLQFDASQLSSLAVPSWLFAAGVVVVLVWLLNLYNFMDGIDGIAGMQCVLYGAAVAVLADGPDPTVALALVLASAGLGFLVFNWAPAKIFMGDVGSGFLGLAIGLVALDLEARGIVPLVASLILLVLFWFDATYTLCARILTRQVFTAPHRSHAYQRIARRLGHGWTTSTFTLVAIVWLGPLAWYSTVRPEFAAVCVCLAILPILTACVWLRAGLPERVDD